MIYSVIVEYVLDAVWVCWSERGLSQVPLHLWPVDWFCCYLKPKVCLFQKPLMTSNVQTGEVWLPAHVRHGNLCHLKPFFTNMICSCRNKENQLKSHQLENLLPSDVTSNKEVTAVWLSQKTSTSLTLLCDATFPFSFEDLINIYRLKSVFSFQ